MVQYGKLVGTAKIPVSPIYKTQPVTPVTPAPIRQDGNMQKPITVAPVQQRIDETKKSIETHKQQIIKLENELNGMYEEQKAQFPNMETMPKVISPTISKTNLYV